MNETPEQQMAAFLEALPNMRLSSEVTEVIASAVLQSGLHTLRQLTILAIDEELASAARARGE